MERGAGRRRRADGRSRLNGQGRLDLFRRVGQLEIGDGGILETGLILDFVDQQLVLAVGQNRSVAVHQRDEGETDEPLLRFIFG